MAINFDKALGMHQYTLGVRSRRAEILASNLTNADTPDYKARDLNFKEALLSARSGSGISLSRTNEIHRTGHSFSMQQSNQYYRTGNQPDTGDGNNVDAEVERNLFMKNSLQYQASLDFLNSKISGLRKAIKGQ
ncbi:flagellar basal-body rod protein FlgB [Psychromonas sp. CNPT3]|uniref:flagellar basal body rod protein FlgB n=1 Tax=Psychromonas sp. CNPT3 TaxID=314282 RepID=UPI00006E349A|nr:flagellar basal body rod protein FlgB [Psychromonas sp. CNPT3]AGH80566.1 flagellar basal-body rod protein FlgB [Psychromonas sp. CNPT3]